MIKEEEGCCYVVASIPNNLAPIHQFQGNEFKTKTNLPFRYSLESGTIWVERDRRRINQSLVKSNFEQVYGMMKDKPLAGPGEIKKRVENGQYGDSGIKSQVRGTSYVWAILNDKRIVS